MNKIANKIVLMMFCLCVFVGMMKVESAKAFDLGSIVYVNGITGDNINDGLTEETAVKTIMQAYSIVGDGGKIIVSGDTYFTESGKLSWDSFIVPSVAVTIEAINNSKLTMSASVYLQADTTFQNMTLVGKNSGNFLVANGYTLKFGENLVYDWNDGSGGNGFNIIGGQVFGNNAPIGLTSKSGSNLIFESGGFVIVIAGPVGTGRVRDDNAKVDLSSSDEYKVTVGGNATISDLYLGAMWELTDIPNVKLPSSILTVDGNNAFVKSVFGGSYLIFPVAKKLNIEQNSSTINLINGKIGDILGGGVSLSYHNDGQLLSSIEEVNVNIAGGEVGSILSGGIVLSGGKTAIVNDHIEKMTIQTEISLVGETKIFANGSRQEVYGKCSDDETTSTASLEVILVKVGAINDIEIIENGGEVAKTKTITLRNGNFKIPAGFDNLQLEDSGVGILVGDLALNKLSSDNSKSNGIIYKQSGDNFPILELGDFDGVKSTVQIDFINESGSKTAPLDGQVLINFPKGYVPNVDAFALNSSNTNNSGFGINFSEAALVVSIDDNQSNLQDEFHINIQNDGNGTATSNVESAVEGTEITLSADPNIGYKFKSWQVINGNVEIIDNKFLMPTTDVTIKAIFEEILVSSISVSTNNAANHISTKNGTLQLTVDVQPIDAKNKNVVWASSDSNIATVDQNGLVTAKNNGSVIISAKAADGSSVLSSISLSLSGQGITNIPHTGVDNNYIPFVLLGVVSILMFFIEIRKSTKRFEFK